MMSKLHTLYETCGQSIWLDYIDRNLLTNGGLRDLIAEGVRGVTSNPTIFHKAISEGDHYDDSIKDLIQADAQIDAPTLYQWLTVEDVQMAADLLLNLYRKSGGGDGYVSLEVSPHLADDTAGTIEAARHLWKMVDKPNLMVKVPATRAGLPAIETLIAEGINVNVTLLFSLQRYRQVVQAYIRGLAHNPQPQTVASVASFFVSRVDSAVDAELERLDNPQAERLKGRIAIANAKLAYRNFLDTFSSQDFEEQRRRGARVQRPLWASTSTKNPRLRDVLYVESLIGPNTVNTVPPATLDAFLAHGELRATLDEHLTGVERDLEALDAAGVDLTAITDELERDGVAKFAASHDALLELLERKRFEVSKEYANA